MKEQDQAVPEHGFAVAVNDDGEEYHQIGIYNESDQNEWIEYSIDVDDVLDPKQDDVNIYLADYYL